MKRPLIVKRYCVTKEAEQVPNLASRRMWLLLSSNGQSYMWADSKMQVFKTYQEAVQARTQALATIPPARGYVVNIRRHHVIQTVDQALQEAFT